mmetsp:Transcript_28934/g.70533  ORF Transcript_28934/g.70533 Transcript_28934/m.70533 type:complete len:220 (+) Transcript_28934:113-772(+)
MSVVSTCRACRRLGTTALNRAWSSGPTPAPPRALRYPRTLRIAPRPSPAPTDRRSRLGRARNARTSRRSRKRTRTLGPKEDSHRRQSSRRCPPALSRSSDPRPSSSWTERAVRRSTSASLASESTAPEDLRRSNTASASAVQNAGRSTPGPIAANAWHVRSTISEAFGAVPAIQEGCVRSRISTPSFPPARSLRGISFALFSAAVRASPSFPSTRFPFS